MKPYHVITIIETIAIGYPKDVNAKARVIEIPHFVEDPRSMAMQMVEDFAGKEGAVTVYPAGNNIIAEASNGKGCFLIYSIT